HGALPGVGRRLWIQPLRGADDVGVEGSPLGVARHPTAVEEPALRRAAVAVSDVSQQPPDVAGLVRLNVLVAIVDVAEKGAHRLAHAAAGADRRPLEGEDR